MCLPISDIEAMEESIDARFLRLVTHPALRPMRMDAIVLELIPPLVKRQWIEFARKLETHLMGSAEEVEAILSRKPDGTAPRKVDAPHDPVPTKPKTKTNGAKP